MSRKLVYVLATAAALAFASAASAEEISGTVVSINSEAQTITLDNGMTFSLSEDVSIEGLAPGQTVKVMYESRDSGNIATGVERPEN